VLHRVHKTFALAKERREIKKDGRPKTGIARIFEPTTRGRDDFQGLIRPRLHSAFPQQAHRVNSPFVKSSLMKV
jgi:hypothetical protein